MLPVFWTLPPQFMVGLAAAGGIAVINSVGNLGGFVGPSIMGYLIDRTGNYPGGFVFDAIMLCVSATTVAILTKSRKV